jgi:hypothetical protein
MRDSGAVPETSFSTTINKKNKLWHFLNGVALQALMLK